MAPPPRPMPWSLEEGITVHQICYNFYKLHKEIFKWFISALTNLAELLEEKTEISQDIFQSLHKEGYAQ